MLDDGSVVVADDDRDAVAARRRRVRHRGRRGHRRTTSTRSTTRRPRASRDLNVGYVGNQDDRLSLAELGFDDLTPLTATGVNANPALLDDVDVLWVGDVVQPQRRPPGATAVQAFVDVGSLHRRTHQPGVQRRGDLRPAVRHGQRRQRLRQRHRRRRHPGGLGAGAVRPGRSSFIYPAYWFTVPSDVEVAQPYGTPDPLLAGHWRAGTSRATRCRTARPTPRVSPQWSRTRSPRVPGRSCSAPLRSTAPTPRAA